MRMFSAHTAGISNISASIRTDFHQAHLRWPLLSGGRTHTITSVHMMLGWRASRFQSQPPVSGTNSVTLQFESDCLALITTVSSSCSTRACFDIPLVLLLRHAVLGTGVTMSLHCRRLATLFTKLSGLDFSAMMARAGLLKHRISNSNGRQNDVAQLCVVGAAQSAIAPPTSSRSTCASATRSPSAGPCLRRRLRL